MQAQTSMLRLSMIVFAYKERRRLGGSEQNFGCGNSIAIAIAMLLTIVMTLAIKQGFQTY